MKQPKYSEASHCAFVLYLQRDLVETLHVLGVCSALRVLYFLIVLKEN